MTKSAFKPQHLEPLPEALLSDPLEYILADHLRQRVLCHLCDRLADADCLDRDIAVEVADHIRNDFSIHVIDEEQDLFPLLRRRARPEDAIEVTLGELSGQHADGEALADEILRGLDACLDAPVCPLKPKLAKALKTFAHSERSHLALENAIIVPLARVRLTKKDLKELAARMAARRGVVLRPGGRAAR